MDTQPLHNVLNAGTVALPRADLEVPDSNEESVSHSISKCETAPPPLNAGAPTFTTIDVDEDK